MVTSKARIKKNSEADTNKGSIFAKIARNHISYSQSEGRNQEKFLKPEADRGYPLAKIAMESINAYKTLGTSNLLLDEIIDRLTPAVNNGNIDASYRLARMLEGNPSYELQKRCVQYYIKSAEHNPAAMIRLGEIYEQGFYYVEPDAKKANAYYSEGLRLLFMLSNHGHPLSIANLARAALEGLGMKQDTKLAEQCYKITRNNGYEDPEFWFWEKYRVAMRRVRMPEGVAKLFGKTRLGGDEDYTGVASDAIQNPRTCFYLVREKLYSIKLWWRGGSAVIGLVNRTVDGVLSEFYPYGEKVDNDAGFDVFDQKNQRWDIRRFFKEN